MPTPCAPRPRSAERSPRRRSGPCVALALLAGCASTNAEPSFRDVAASVAERSGLTPRWNRGTSEDRQADRAVDKLLANPLSSDGAVQIALLRNATLQATYEELSLAQADLVDAGLLRNPVFSADVTTAERDALSPNLIAGVTQSFLDLLLIPARRAIAKSQLDAAKFRVGSEVLDLEARVRTEYLAVVAAEQTLAMRRVVAEAEDAASEIARRQFAAGNVNELAMQTQRVLAQQLALETDAARADVAANREHLVRSMGLGDAVGWRTIDRLPEVPESEPPLEDLESRALAHRLDLAALRQEAETLNAALRLAETSRWTGVVDIGADVARLRDGSVVVGPRASIELPIFDQRQGTIARLEAQLRTSRSLLAARIVDVRSEVRESRGRLLYAREVVDRYRREIVPARERLVALTQEQYNAMLLGVFQLVEAKRSELGAYRAYIDSVRDYWISRAELEHAVGTRVPIVTEARKP